MSEILKTEKEGAVKENTGWENLAEPGETWEEHLAKAEKLAETGGKISLEKPRVKMRNEAGEMVEKTNLLTKTIYSYFNRYPEQSSLVDTMMAEAYRDGRPLKVLDIGVARGQEALGYVQRAANIAGEDNIDGALDLELVEYAADIPMIEKEKLPDDISANSYDYLSRLYDAPKAHFDTPFQGFVRELNEKNEKRDVVLFNNVIQHLDYVASKEEMMNDMRGLAEVVAENGVLCMTCEQHVLDSNQEVAELFGNTDSMLEEAGFAKVTDGVYRKNAIVLDAS